MSAVRQRIPTKVKNVVLETSGRRCCISFSLHKDDGVKRGQIAHLNRDSSHNAPDNLAFLCLAHHDEFDSRTSQSTGFSAPEIKHYQAKLSEYLTELDILLSRKFKPLPNAEPQFTRWGPVDELPPGVSIEARNGEFVSWRRLEREIKGRILPQVDALNDKWSDIKLADHHGKKDWIIEVLDKSGHVIANVWFGPNPLKNWASDGRVRVGPPDAPPRVWQVYQRYSDGSYRRLNPDDFKLASKAV